ncbi:MAG: Rrf2 family transcriptional regulator [Patescibacteria group bacterium]|jgi:Rrf2 family protein
MKFSTKSSYGLRAMIQLARHYRGGSLSLGEISRREKISLGYLEKIMASLKSAKLVDSAAGIKGGYMLTESPAKISIKEIFEALEGSVTPFACAEAESFCTAKDCGARLVWQKLNQAIKKTLKQITLAEIIK